MNRRMTKVFSCVALGGVMLFAGCKSQPAPAGKLNSDGSTTNPDGSVTYPAGMLPPGAAGSAPSVAVAPPSGAGPAESRSNPGGPAAMREPGPQVTKIPSGTRVEISVSETLSASRNNAGDQFQGVLSSPLTYEGTVIYPRGTSVTGTVAAAKGRGRFKGSGDLAIELNSIGGTTVSTTEYEKSQAGKGKRTAGMIGGGGGLGALIGGLTGGGKGALIGGLAGAGAGTAAAAYTGNKDVVIPAESVVTFTLTAPMSVRTRN